MARLGQLPPTPETREATPSGGRKGVPMPKEKPLIRKLPLGTIHAYSEAFERSKRAGESDLDAHIAGLGAALANAAQERPGE